MQRPGKIIPLHTEQDQVDHGQRGRIVGGGIGYAAPGFAVGGFQDEPVLLNRLQVFAPGDEMNLRAPGGASVYPVGQESAEIPPHTADTVH